MLLVNYSCNDCKSWGDNNLGGKFTLLEGDRQEDRIIVYCTSNSKCCHAGISIIPSKDFGITKAWVEKAEFNERWIIANSFLRNGEELGFWIIDKDYELDLSKCEEVDCDSIIQSHVIGPLDTLQFEEKKKELGIDLKFK